MSSIAMSNNNHIYVRKKPIIGILSTGNEIIEVGERLTENKIPSGNNLMISSMVKIFGGIPRVLPIANDKIEEIENILNKNLDCNLFVSNRRSICREV